MHMNIISKYKQGCHAEARIQISFLINHRSQFIHMSYSPIHVHWALESTLSSCTIAILTKYKVS